MSFEALFQILLIYFVILILEIMMIYSKMHSSWSMISFKWVFSSRFVFIYLKITLCLCICVHVRVCICVHMFVCINNHVCASVHVRDGFRNRHKIWCLNTLVWLCKFGCNFDSSGYWFWFYNPHKSLINSYPR